MTHRDFRATWRELLRQEGRTIAWLADRTGRNRKTVYAYSIGVRRATDAWLEDAAKVLGIQLKAEAA